MAFTSGFTPSDRSRRSPHAPLARAVMTALLIGCHGRSIPADPAAALDPRAVLAVRLSHGVGNDPLESPLLADSIDAAIVVRARHSVDSAGLARSFGSAGDLRERLEALVGAGVLRREGRAYHTSRPIVIGADRTWYDSVTRAWARGAIAEVRPAVDSARHEIARRGLDPWGYHLLFSQLFDSQALWVAVQRSRVTPPLGTAVSWVVYPEHPRKTGTDLFGRIGGPFFLAVTWTPTVRTQLGRLEPAADSLIAVTRGARVSAGVRQNLVRLGLLTPDGSAAIPVLSADDPLARMLRDGAERWAAAALRTIDAPLLARRLETDARVAWAMAYHDFSWSALALLIDSGLIAPPPTSGFDPPARGSASLAPADSAFLAALTETAVRP